MKGITKIELFNAETGVKEREVIEENFITNAVKDIGERMFNQAFSSMLIPAYGNITDFLCPAKLTTAILLNNELQNVDASEIFYKGQTIGFAEGDYAGADPYRGDYNAAESGALPGGGFKFVYDFDTDKANGTINSVSLCSTIARDINLFTLYQAGTVNVSYRVEDSGGTEITLTGDIVTGNDGKVYGRNSVDGQIYQVVRQPVDYDFVNYNIGTSIYTPTGSIKALNWDIDADKLVIVEQIAGVDHFITMNGDGTGVVDITMTGVANVNRAMELTDYIIYGDSSGNLKSFNKATSAIITHKTDISFNHIMFKDSGRAYSIYNGDYNSAIPCYEVDNSLNVNTIIRNCRGTTQFDKYGSGSGFNVYGLNLIPFTINNLVAPVTKNNTQTMKVTYDLIY